MFNALQSLNNNTTATESVNLEVSNELLISSLENLADVEVELAGVFAMSDTIDNLDALHGSIEKFGLQKGLVAFADHDLMLSTAISSFPALESFSGDLIPGSAEAKRAIEGIIDTIKETVTKWAGKAWEVASKAVMSVSGVVTGWIGKLKDFLTKAKDKVFNSKKAENVEGDVPSAGLLKKLLDAIKSLPEKLKAVWNSVGTTTKEAYEAFVKKLGMGPKEASAESFSSAALEDYYAEAEKESKMNAKKNLGSLGYTAQIFKDLMSWIRSFVTGTLPEFIKSLGPMIKKAFSAVTSHAGEAAMWARKSVTAALKWTWEHLNELFRKGLGLVFRTAKKAEQATDGEGGTATAEPKEGEPAAA